MKIENSAMYCSLIAAWLIAGTAYASTSELAGCWRLQHIEQVMLDKKIIHLNSDCVADINETQFRSPCITNKGEISYLYNYRITAPGKMVTTIISGPEKTSHSSAPRQVDYVVDGDWLMLTSYPSRMADVKPNALERITSLYIRDNLRRKQGQASKPAACAPKGPSRLKVNRGPVSSLDFTVPDGYQPVSSDPYANQEMAKALNSNFLIGQFVESTSSQANSLSVTDPFVLVMEDYRTGARPIRSLEFSDLKKRLKADIGMKNISCETDKIICFENSYQLNESGTVQSYVTVEFVNVKGRVAIVYGSAQSTTKNAKSVAKKLADVFTAQVIQDNP